MISPETIVSSRILLLNESHEAIVLRRETDGLLDLPGGKIEAGESVTVAGLRETYEELGIAPVEIALSGIVYTNVNKCDDGIVRRRHFLIGKTAANPRWLSDHIDFDVLQLHALADHLAKHYDRSAVRYVMGTGKLAVTKCLRTPGVLTDLPAVA